MNSNQTSSLEFARKAHLRITEELNNIDMSYSQAVNISYNMDIISDAIKNIEEYDGQDEEIPF